MKDDLTDRMAESFKANGMPVALKVSHLSSLASVNGGRADRVVHCVWKSWGGIAVLGPSGY
jgi:hypothetical protein